MEAWWCIVSRDKERDKKPLAQEKEKNSTHSLTDVRACSFSHAGGDKFRPEPFDIIQKRCRYGDN